MNAPAASAHVPLTGPYLERVDPRLRIVAAIVLSIAIALLTSFTALIVALLAALALVPLTSISLTAALRRTVPVNVVVLILAAVLPLTTAGTPLATLGPLEFSREGLLLAAAVALKGNAIVLLLMALVGTLEPVTLGHALDHLYVPTKLAHLLLFTVRYVDVLHREYLRLRAAMKVRGFRPRMNRTPTAAYGYLVGMLLVRSFDRSERIAGGDEVPRLPRAFLPARPFRHVSPGATCRSAVAAAAVLAGRSAVHGSGHDADDEPLIELRRRRSSPTTTSRPVLAGCDFSPAARRSAWHCSAPTAAARRRSCT